MIELIAVIQNNPYMGIVETGIILLAIGLTMYILQCIKLIKSIPTPPAPVMTLLAIIITSILAELGTHTAIGIWGGGWIIGALLQTLIYTFYRNVDPEEQFLTALVRFSIGRGIRLIDKNAGISQNDSDPAIKQ